MIELAFMFVMPFIAAALIMPLARRIAIKTGYVDAPGGRKQHDEPVPPIGGVVIFPVYIGAMLLAGATMPHFLPLFVGLIVLVITGALDEKMHLNAWLKFVIQMAVVLMVVLTGDARIYQLGNLFGFGDVGLTFLSIPFSVAAIMLLINAMNLMDGLDGLAGGFGFIAFAWLMFAAAMAGAWGHVFAMAPLEGALLGFLIYNMRHPLRKKAGVFLGDAGSVGLGLALAWFSIAIAQQRGQVLPPISVAWILAIPVMDTCAQFFRRLLERRHPFAPDRGHFHHHFIHAGITPGESVAFILAIAFILGAIGFVGNAAGMPQSILTVAWLAVLAAHMAISRKPQIYIDLFARLAKP